MAIEQIEPCWVEWDYVDPVYGACRAGAWAVEYAESPLTGVGRFRVVDHLQERHDPEAGKWVNASDLETRQAYGRLHPPNA